MARVRSANRRLIDPVLNRLGMDFVKSVVHPTKQVGFSSALRGFVEEFGHVWEDVLYMEGELHLNRKSVCPSTPPWSRYADCP